MQSIRCWGFPVAGIMALALMGCGNSGPAVYPVHGKVMFEGKALAGGGSIAFVPLGNQAGKTAGGDIGADGSYRLTTHREGDGSMAGEFRVVIMQVTEDEPERTPDGQKAKAAAKVVALADRIPAIYSDHHQSPLKTKVEAKSSNELNFELKRN